MSEINRIFGAQQTGYSTNVQKADRTDKTSNILFDGKTEQKPTDGWGFMGLNLNNAVEARMQNFFETDPNMRILDEIFGI